MQVTNGGRVRYVGWSDTTKGDRNMKKLIAALALTAAVATPAMAQTYVQSDAMTSPHAVQAQPDVGYDAYAYAPPGYDTTRINSPIFAMDPDPNVRLQLQKQSDMFNR
jgi:hypothetical protein